MTAGPECSPNLASNRLPRLKDECLNENWFKDLVEARQVARGWLRDYNHYNHHRPHTALGGLPPAEFAHRWAELRSPRAPSAQPSDTTPINPDSVSFRQACVNSLLDGR
ncbi:integrase core domain-containing protein [Mesoterricola silvestris]|uniref:integrase core domain-containing protein n=1 Tax=Mesoterricola silvestris TaxID=2927979 RepID=UPI00374358C2